MSELKQLSIDPNKVNKSDIVALIKSNDEKIKLLETEAQQINDVIERLREAQSIINEYVLSDISDRSIALKKRKCRNSKIAISLTILLFYKFVFIVK